MLVNAPCDLRINFKPVQFDLPAGCQPRNMIVEDLTMAIVDRLPNEWGDSHDMIILATAFELQARYGEVSIVSSDRKMRFDQSLNPCPW